jgi:lipoyl(octanoyl) transferase
MDKFTDFKQFGLESKNFITLDERTTIVKKWNWDYSQAHAFQKYSVAHLQENPRERILICCSHPRVLTNGRGLQKPRKGEVLNLKEFRASDYPALPFPLHQIERGGGLTFHHPGQFIFYPIVKLNPQTLSLSKMVDDIFESAMSVLKIEGLDHQNKLMGLWQDDKKIASMGIAIEKLTTYHGMALNYFKDEEMKKALTLLNPCGMSAETYTSVEEITSNNNLSLDSFTDSFLGRIGHAWK